MSIRSNFLGLILCAAVATSAYADGIINAGGAAPSGPAGGDLSGTYPNPSVAKIGGTAPGTGVATALGVNVGSAGAFVTFNGAGGTPSSMTATNLTGTASGLTAGNVTTNANLTGVITSVGNATSIASQTGTGTKFVVDTSPTLVTPVLGVAVGTSLALGGATIGSNALAVTGAVSASGNIQTSAGNLDIAANSPGLRMGASLDSGIWRKGAASFGMGTGASGDVSGSLSLANLSAISGSITVSGNQSIAAWTTNGAQHKTTAATLTDTSSSGTVAAAYTNLFGGNTIAASSATTFTNYYGSYFSTPTVGSNVTFTNGWALGADSAKINGILTTSGTITSGNHITLANASAIFWATRTNLYSPADGALLVQISAGSNGVKFGVSATDGLLNLGTSAGATGNALGSLNLTNLTASGNLSLTTSGSTVILGGTHAGSTLSTLTFTDYANDAGRPQILGNWPASGAWGMGPNSTANDSLLRIGVASGLSVNNPTWGADTGGIVTGKKIWAGSGTGLTSGGDTSLVLMASSSSQGIYFGSGAPTISAAQGSLYIRSDGSSTSTRLYVNTNGSTGWTNFTSGS